MNSFAVRGKYWITQEGKVIDCSGDEHARIARAHMLGIKNEDMGIEIPLNKVFVPLSEDQVKHYQRSDKECVEFLSRKVDYVDAREFVIEKWDWIRTRENKFYAWEWNEKTFNRLRGAKSFWRKTSVDKNSFLCFVSLKDGKDYGITYEAFTNMEVATC